MAATWAIAVGEPTPTEEIVASVITVYVGAMLLYEVIVCKKSYPTNRAECQERYEDSLYYSRVLAIFYVSLICFL